MRDWILRRDKKDNCRAALAIALFGVVVLNLFFLAVCMEKEGKAVSRREEGTWWFVAIRYHANYPTGEDRVYEVRCGGREEGRGRAEVGIDRMFSYKDCGFDGFLPLKDRYTWYLEKENITPVRRLRLPKNTACDLYAGWK